MAPNTPKQINLDDVGEGASIDDILNTAIDFEAVKGIQVVPYGEYRLRVEAGSAVLSKSSSQPMVKLRCTILSGEYEGVTQFIDLSLAPTAVSRSKPMLIGMGMPEDANWSPRAVAENLKDAEFYGILDVEQSDGINPKTNRPYDARNKLVSASATPQVA